MFTFVNRKYQLLLQITSKAMKPLPIKPQYLSSLQNYQLETIKLTEEMIKNLMKNNAFTQERLMQFFDEMVDFSPKALKKGSSLKK